MSTEAIQPRARPVAAARPARVRSIRTRVGDRPVATAPSTDPAAHPRDLRFSGWLLASLAAIALGVLVAIGAGGTPAWGALPRPDWTLSPSAHAVLGGLATVLLAFVAALVENARAAAPVRSVAQLLLASAAVLGALAQGFVFALEPGAAGFLAAGIWWLITVLAWTAAASLRSLSTALAVPYVLWSSYVVLVSGSMWLLNR
jgi:translocator protein